MDSIKSQANHLCPRLWLNLNAKAAEVNVLRVIHLVFQSSIIAYQCVADVLCQVHSIILPYTVYFIILH